MKIVQVDATGIRIAASAVQRDRTAVSVSPCGCLEMLRAAFRAAKSAGQAIMDPDGPLRKRPDLERVRGICAACPTLHKGDGLRLWCGEPMRLVEGVACGCLVNLKTRLATEGCPQGKW